MDTSLPVLLVAVPNVPLFMKKEKEALGLSMGACFVGGSIEHFGFSLEYFDFNYSLNAMRPAGFTSERTVEVLYKDEKIIPFLRGEVFDETLIQWANDLLDTIPKKNYFAICLSLDVREPKSILSKASFGFAFLLAKELRKRAFECPIFLGGKKALSLATNDFVQFVSKNVDDNPFAQICLGDAYANMGKLLARMREGLSPNSPEAINLLATEDTLESASAILPRFRLSNQDDALMRANDLFPMEIQARWPKLKELEPFIIAPYKFSFGCPFTCAFCTDGVDRKFFQFRAQNIVDKIYRLHKQGIRNFGFYNNNINLNKTFLDQLELGIKEAGIKIQFSDSANLQNSSTEIFQQLARIGAVKLWYGTETVSGRLLSIINKNLSREKIENGLKNADDADIWSNCNFIYNFPHETNEEFEELFNFISNSRLVNGFDYNEFRLVPGSAYLADPKKFGIELIAMSDTGRIGAFNEINRHKWLDRIAIGKEKTKRLNKLKRDINFTMAYNDYIVFGCRSLGFSKPQIVEIMKTYTQLLRLNKAESKYENMNKMYLPFDQFYANREPSIGGHSFKKATEVFSTQ